LQLILRLAIGAFEACHIHPRSHLILGELATWSPRLDQSLIEGWRDRSHLATNRQRLSSILTVRSDVDRVQIAGVCVCDESIAGAGGHQLIRDCTEGVLICFIAPWVGLTREDDGFRDTDALEGIS